jgi:two-component system, OmpR family, KDP operon response regulator KdpE
VSAAEGGSVLVCDDEPQILRALKVVLREAGFEAIGAETAREALDAAAVRRPDAAIVDLVLPDGDGVEVCAQLRSWSEMPILVLSAVGEEEQKVRALEAGADDYVTKPFAIDELLARIRALTRRVVAPGDEPIVTFGVISVDFAAKQVLRRQGARSENVRLTPTEWRILELLVHSPGKLVTRESLLTQIWGPHHTKDTGYLRLYFAQLRKKLEPVPSEPQYLVTVLGMGYRFVPDASSS